MRTATAMRSSEICICNKKKQCLARTAHPTRGFFFFFNFFFILTYLIVTKQRREITKFKILWRTLAHDAN